MGARPSSTPRFRLLLPCKVCAETQPPNCSSGQVSGSKTGVADYKTRSFQRRPEASETVPSPASPHSPHPASHCPRLAVAPPFPLAGGGHPLGSWPGLLLPDDFFPC